MKSKGKKLLSVLLSGCMLCGMFPAGAAYAAEDTQTDLVRYEKNYEDGITGTWEGAAAAIVDDPDHPGNRVLELKNFDRGGAGLNLARDASAPALADGTISMKVKALSSSKTFYRMGFIYRAEDAVKEANQLTESGGWFICNEGSFNVGYPKYTALEMRGGIKTNEWIDVKIQYVGAQVEISINNVRCDPVSIDGQSLKAGTFGFRNANGATFLVDDVVFTNEMLDMGEEYVEPDIDTGRLEVSEDYSKETGDWTGSSAAVSGGYQVTVPASGVVANQNDEMSKMGYGLNTYIIKTDAQGRFGVAFNYVNDQDYNALYSSQPGEFKLKSAKSGLNKVIASDSMKLEANTEYEVKVENISGGYKFYLDGVLVAEGAEEGLSGSKGTIGLYNPTNAESQMFIKACGVYEMYYYFNDFSDPANLGGWEGNATVSHVEDGQLNGGGELSLNMKAVTNAIAKDTPMIKDGVYEFDIKNTPDNPASIGRVGFLFRSRDQADYQGIFFDTGSSWFWLNGSAYGAFNGKAALKDGDGYHVRLETEGNNMKLYVDGELIGYGSYSLPARQGHFGLRKQYSNSNIRLDNLRVTETVKVNPKEKEDKPITINGEQMSVTMDQNFPRVMGYEMNGKVLPGNLQKAYGLRINGSVYYPLVNCEKKGENTLAYELKVPNLGVTLKVSYVVDGHQFKMSMTDIVETGSFQVKDVQFDNDVLVSTDPADASASMATVLVGGGWTSVSEKVCNTMADAELGQTSATYGMIASNGLAATINNSVVQTNSRLNIDVANAESAKVGSMGNGSFTYRKIAGQTEELPWAVVDLCEDYNQDGSINWQDAAANYKNIRDEVYGVDQMKDNMMYVAMNFASQVQEPFLKTLDMGKVIYNYTDGFGQMIMHKGYTAEGHDDSHGDYGGHIGVRQGGKEDFNYVIEEGKNYNLKFGIHINVSEHNPDAFNFNPDVMTAPFAANWGWIDQAYFTDEMADITSGNRDKNFDQLKADLPDLNFIYVDIYGNAGWEADNLTKALNSRGYIVGTEFSGPIEQGAAFTHWGNDIHYPNTGNESTVMRYFKNDLDIFVANALTKGNKMPGVATWGDTSMKEAVDTFYNHVLPTKYMQHYNVLDVEDTYVTFSNGLKTEKFGTGNAGDKDNIVVMTKNGKKMAQWTWQKSGAQEVTGETTLLIPWDPDTDEKLYHWNPAGTTTTWDVPESWTKAGITSADLYQLSGEDKIKTGTVEIKDGQITLTAEKGVGYVLYPAGSQKPIVAGDFGQGGPLGNPGFDTKNLSDWNVKDNNTTTTVETNAKYENFLSMKGQAGSNAEISQTMDGLTPGTTNTIYLFADISKGSKLDMMVEAGGKQFAHSAEYTNVVYHGQSKYENSSYQKVKVTFDVPEGVTSAKLTLNASMTQANGTVKIDDVRFWENISRTPQTTDPGYENYAIYEDFENVEQGYGVMELAYSSGIYTHLAEYKAEANQYTNYVVDGNFSLKTNELGDYVGQVLRTNPNQAKLKPNTNYDIGFGYMTGVDGRHHMEVRDSKGNIAYRYDFTSTPVQEGAHKLSSRQVNASFTTGAAEDYYVVVYKDSNNLAYPQAPEQGSYMERIFLSLDNLIVKESATQSDLEGKLAEAKAINAAGYTEESFATLQQAIAEAERVLALENPTQQEISDAYQGLTDAINGLKEVVKKGDLQTLYNQNKDRSEENYTASSWTEFQAALTNAEMLLTNDDATQAQIDGAKTTLQTAIDKLVNISTLSIVLDMAKSHVTNGDVDKLIPAAKAEFEKALAKAQGVYDNANATQSEVDASWKLLLYVIQALDFVPGDDAKLIELVAAAKAVELNGYEDGATKDAFTTALSEAEALLLDKNAMQADFDAAYEKLEKAMSALIPLPESGDKTQLGVVIETAESYDLSKYVDDANKTNFSKVLAEAKDLYDNNDKATQGEIDAMRSKLLNAMNNLRLRADKETLNDWINALKGIDLNEYTAESASALRAVIAKAEALAAQDLGKDETALIQAMIAEMVSVKENLVKAEDPSKLEEPSDNSSTGKPSTDKTPTTGDAAPIAALSLLALAAAGVVLVMKKKREN